MVELSELDQKRAKLAQKKARLVLDLARERLVEGGIPAADQNVVLAQGFIENSNVNAIEELVDTLSQQRLFEVNVKFISLSEQIDEGGASIMRLPQ